MGKRINWTALCVADAEVVSTVIDTLLERERVARKLEHVAIMTQRNTKIATVVDQSVAPTAITKESHAAGYRTVSQTGPQFPIAATKTHPLPKA